MKELKRKGDLFKKKYLYYLFPWNTKCRARGYYLSIKEYIDQLKDEDFIYKEIVPPTDSELCLTDQMLELTSDYVHYDKKIVEPSKYIVSVNNGRILTDQMWNVSIFDSCNKLIGDISLDLLLAEGEKITDSRIFRRKYFPTVKYFQGTVFPTIGGGGTYDNYAHWLVDSFSRLYLLKESGLLDTVDWFYVPSVKYDYQRDSLKAIGITEDKIIDSTKHPHIKADKLLVSSYTRGNYYHLPSWVVDFYSSNFKSVMEPRFKSKRYFISRKDSALRNIINEDEISLFFKRYNIETVVLSELSFQEKIDLFASADLIISLWGAGLTNFLFCKEGAKVVEMFGDKHVDFTLYYDIAIKKNLNYFYLIGENKGDLKNWKEGQKSDVYININDLKHLLEEGVGID